MKILQAYKTKNKTMTDFNYIKTLFNIQENNGFTDEELQNIRKVSSNIPQVLYDYYVQLGKITKLNQTQDSLLIPEQVQWSKNKDYLIFYAENQWACVWAIQKEDLTEENPSVYMSKNQETWEKESETLTDFLNAMANLQAVFSFEYSSEDFLFINEEELKFIKQNFQKKPFAFKKWIGIDFYGNFIGDIIAIFNNKPYYDVCYAASNKEHFEEIDKLIRNLGEK
ncbi:hypothetical protein [Capnocytophaga felis]|uniref:Knr4/Smi1-like domain-containing protein n=1 Tax=Capnocytophaga felis TaxID=2267611 RepID=A0A5M4B821_9FLAO|nr:hypothetical protein [Capnocytophaga felis]GET45407.1 hypothetical protein RCZ01_07090 [Capnocytophaga felis]GET47430.1 hypothetical protein RCZ02_02610 [Capnocytophaga felis]